jgi:NCAIR mutase (PurE)-related protein
MNQDRLAALLQRVQGGKVSVPQAIRQLRTLPFEDLGFASVDHHRSLRQGFPEVILCEGKTPAQIRAIARNLLKAGGPFLATRVSPANARSLKRLARKAVYYEMARMVAIFDGTRTKQGLILVVTAGTSDIPVAEEARVTAEVMGSRVQTL